MNDRIYGAKVPISVHLFSEIIGVEGKLVHVSFDPISLRVDFYFVGDEDHFPEVSFACYAPECMIEYTTSFDGVVKRVDKTVLVDPLTGMRYVHRDFESKSLGGNENGTNKDIQNNEE